MIPKDDLNFRRPKGVKEARSTRWLPVKDADIVVLKNIFNEIDCNKNKAIEVSEMIHYFSSHTEVLMPFPRVPLLSTHPYSFSDIN